MGWGGGGVRSDAGFVLVLLCGSSTVQYCTVVSPRGALGPGGLWFLVMCTLDGPSLA